VTPCSFSREWPMNVYEAILLLILPVQQEKIVSCNDWRVLLESEYPFRSVKMIDIKADSKMSIIKKLLIHRNLLRTEECQNDGLTAKTVHNHGHPLTLKCYIQVKRYVHTHRCIFMQGWIVKTLDTNQYNLNNFTSGVSCSSSTSHP
jgi:hypothetical protein